MACYQTDYQSLSSVNEDTDTPPDNVIFHVPPEKSRWNHIEDLDSFFRKVYRYHQKHGFGCILTSEIYGLGQFIFISIFVVYVFNCMDYEVVNRHVSYQNTTYVGKLKLTDIAIPANVCIKGLGFFTWICLIIAIIFLISNLCRTIYAALNYYEIKLFYTNALKIPTQELDNTTWHEVQCKLREVQQEQQMCIHKQDLSELDIYHRILRHENYMISMVNKNILPLKYNLPIFGEIVYFPSGLRYNIEVLLFRSPFSPFKSTWQLKDDYKRFNNRNEIAEKLSNAFLILGIANLLLSPFIFLWQVLSFCINYAGNLRKEPGFFGSRKWSQYSRLYLRHFNELDHELTARLNRAYASSKDYIDSFSSNLLTIHARNIAAFSGVIAIYFICWTTIQNDVIEVDYVITTGAAASIICTAVLSFVPNEHAVFIPKKLMNKILGDIHYIPDTWKGKEHTQAVRNEFSQLFQLTFSYMLEQLLSPVFTPLVLMFRLRHRSLDIVDFFRSFTVDVTGVGDVCSFASMDIDKHGHHQWTAKINPKSDQCQQAENGKTELSLVHFTMTNPYWQPPDSSMMFMNDLRGHAQRDFNKLPEMSDDYNALSTSLNSLQSFGKEQQFYVEDILFRASGQRDAFGNSMLRSRRGGETSIQRPVMSGGVSHSEGPLYGQTGILSSLQANMSHGDENLLDQQQEQNPVRFRATEMSLSAMFVHELHYQRLQMLRRKSTQMQSLPPQEHEAEDEEPTGNENVPLLNRR